MSSAPGPKSARRLSVAIVARDEAAVLPVTLASLQSIADEIVLLDTGSRDATRQIAREFRARVIDHVWTDDFSAARNRLWSELTGDWVLWVDAGERLDTESQTLLRQFVDERAEATRAYLVLIEVPPAGAQGYAEQRGCLRLVPRIAGLRFQGRVRESLREAAGAEGLQIQLAPVRLTRDRRDALEEIRRQRARRNLTLAEMDQAACGPQPRLLLTLADAHSTLGMAALATQYYREALDRSPADSTELLEAYYGLLTTYDAQSEASQEQIDLCLQALEQFPLDAQLLCAMAGYLQIQGRLDLAERAYALAWRNGQTDPETWHVRDINVAAATCLALVQQLQGHDDAARQTLEEVLGTAPHVAAARRQLIDLHIKYGRTTEALGELDRLPGITGSRENLRSAVRGACQLATANWIPAIAYLQTAYSAGCRDSICLRWLSVALISNGCRDEALPVVREWLAAEPQNAEANRYLADLTAPASDTGATHAESAIAAAPSDEQWSTSTVALPPATSSVQPTQVSVDATLSEELPQAQGAAGRLAVARALTEAGNPAAAEEMYREQLRKDPQAAQIKQALGELLLASQRIQEGLELTAHLVRGPEAEPRYAEFAAGVREFRVGRYEAALEAFARAQAAGYDAPLVRQFEAHALVRLRRWMAAEPILRELLLRQPANATGHELLAQVLASTGRHREADFVIEQLRGIEGLTTGPHFSLAGANPPAVPQ
ncbi:MAG: tetratricopeptide repeat protein [Pirellulales bacterium]|nr:tetratricopeptide repeat protein [Pirellulales bacterium]